ncbi:hypothetical protein BJ741DRAFT_613065 [Chytriomyces cf. hyalinus JEL632]|nr:hypothetical protein BJ741DRAFT_613065 [Chytriomyces cf. hyalinus JEL632]
MSDAASDSTQIYFQIVAGAIAIYNSIEVLIMMFKVFQKYNSLYFWAVLATTLGIALFAIGFLDLFFKLYEESSNILRPLIVLTIGWYGMVTGFAVTLYSRLAIIRVPNFIQTYIRNFIIYNVVFSHFPTTVFTFGANIVGSEFWVHGYSIIEKIQMTMFCVQEIILGVVYLIYIQKKFGSRLKSLVSHTIGANIVVLVLDISMLIIEYCNLYKYQIMLKVLVYSIKLKFEFYILTLLTEASRDDSIVGNRGASNVGSNGRKSSNNGPLLMDDDVRRSSASHKRSLNVIVESVRLMHFFPQGQSQQERSQRPDPQEGTVLVNPQLDGGTLVGKNGGRVAASSSSERN